MPSCQERPPVLRKDSKRGNFRGFLPRRTSMSAERLKMRERGEGNFLPLKRALPFLEELAVRPRGGGNDVRRRAVQGEVFPTGGTPLRRE